MNIRLVVPVIATALLLSSCVAMVRTASGLVSIRDGMTVTSDGNWNRLEIPTSGPEETWSSDGLPLDVLSFYVALNDGESMMRAPMGSKLKPPIFRHTMSASEVVELYDTTMTLDGSSFKLERLAPIPFGGAPGFRFEFSMTRKRDDVTVRGVAYGAVSKRRLYLITFRAPRQHYYAKHLPRAEAVMKSAVIRN